MGLGCLFSGGSRFRVVIINGVRTTSMAIPSDKPA